MPGIRHLVTVWNPAGPSLDESRRNPEVGGEFWPGFRSLEAVLLSEMWHETLAQRKTLFAFSSSVRFTLSLLRAREPV